MDRRRNHHRMESVVPPDGRLRSSDPHPDCVWVDRLPARHTVATYALRRVRDAVLPRYSDSDSQFAGAENGDHPRDVWTGDCGARSASGCGAQWQAVLDAPTPDGWMDLRSLRKSQPLRRLDGAADSHPPAHFFVASRP